MDTTAVIQRILTQRATRYGDSGPSLGPAGTARFRLESDRLRLGYARAAAGRSPELVARVVEYARSNRLPVQWSVVPQRAGETELAGALLAAGFHQTEDLLLMACEEYLATDRSPGITVAPIMNPQLMVAYEYGSRLCFYDEPHPPSRAVKQRATERWREVQGGWFRYYAAVAGGQLVAGCYCSLFEDVPTLMGVYTLPTARRQGVASQLLAFAVGDILSSDRDVCCLFVERPNPARHLYLKLGFVPLVDMVTFNLDAI